jgi:hypothetical protein
MVVTRSDRHGKAKSIQPGNREWATVIECINAKGWCIPPFVIVQGAYHLANWTTESGFPPSWNPSITRYSESTMFYYCIIVNIATEMTTYYVEALYIIACPISGYHE